VLLLLVYVASSSSSSSIVGCRTGQSLPRWWLLPENSILASPRDNTTSLGRVGYEESLVHVLRQYPWLVLLADVHTCGLGFGLWYTHGGEMSLFSYDALSPSDMKRRHLLSKVVKLPDLLNSSLVSDTFDPE
jgi:hypothetical protein